MFILCLAAKQMDGKSFLGRLLPSKILLRKVLKAIKENAFVASEYPLIITLKNYCGLTQQDVVATLLHTFLGPMLMGGKRLAEKESHYPSPEELKRKIIIHHEKLDVSITLCGVVSAFLLLILVAEESDP